MIERVRLEVPRVVLIAIPPEVGYVLLVRLPSVVGPLAGGLAQVPERHGEVAVRVGLHVEHLLVQPPQSLAEAGRVDVLAWAEVLEHELPQSRSALDAQRLLDELDLGRQVIEQLRLGDERRAHLLRHDDDPRNLVEAEDDGRVGEVPLGVAGVQLGVEVHAVVVREGVELDRVVVLLLPVRDHALEDQVVCRPLVELPGAVRLHVEVAEVRSDPALGVEHALAEGSRDVILEEHEVLPQCPELDRLLLLELALGPELKTSERLLHPVA